MSKNKFAILAFSFCAAGVVFAQPTAPAPHQSGSALPQPQQPATTASAGSNGSRVEEIHPSSISLDELLRSGHLKRGNLQEALPVPLGALPSQPSQPSVAADAVRPVSRSNELSLVAVYMSGPVRVAQVLLDGERLIASVGDRLKGGWLVKSIERHAVDVERCKKGRCSTKTLYLGED
jgi:hypothetical protein